MHAHSLSLSYTHTTHTTYTPHTQHTHHTHSIYTTHTSYITDTQTHTDDVCYSEKQKGIGMGVHVMPICQELGRWCSW